MFFLLTSRPFVWSFVFSAFVSVEHFLLLRADESSRCVFPKQFTVAGGLSLKLCILFEVIAALATTDVGCGHAVGPVVFSARQALSPLSPPPCPGLFPVAMNAAVMQVLKFDIIFAFSNEISFHFCT